LKKLAVLLAFFLVVPVFGASDTRLECLWLLSISLDIFRQDYDSMSYEQLVSIAGQISFYRDVLIGVLEDAIIEAKTREDANEILYLALIPTIMTAMSEFVFDQSAERAAGLLYMLRTVQHMFLR